jgi:hypothetical protein
VDKKGLGSYRGLCGWKRSVRSHRAPPARLPMDLRTRTFAQAHALVRRSPYRAMRLRGIARIGIGIGLALRQYRETPQPSWYQRWFPRYRLAVWLAL